MILNRRQFLQIVPAAVVLATVPFTKVFGELPKNAFFEVIDSNTFNIGEILTVSPVNKPIEKGEIWDLSHYNQCTKMRFVEYDYE